MSGDLFDTMLRDVRNTLGLRKLDPAESAERDAAEEVIHFRLLDFCFGCREPWPCSSVLPSQVSETRLSDEKGSEAP